MISEFLALLDYVSKAHEIEIRQSSVRLWHQLPLNLLRGFFQILAVASPMPGLFFFFFEFLEKNKFSKFFQDFFSFSLTWVPNGAKLRKKATPPSNHF